MSNKTQLQTNNTALDGYITRINAAKDLASSLPEAGGGEGFETSYVSIQHNFPEECGQLCVNGVICYSGIITNVPCFDSMFTVFTLLNFGGVFVENIEITYEAIGDDGPYEESIIPEFAEGYGGFCIYGIYENTGGPTLTFNIAYS